MSTSLKLVAILLATSILFGCNDSAAPQNPIGQQSAFNLEDSTYFNEFVPCTLGAESSPEKMNQMVAEWKTLISSEALDGGVDLSSSI